VLALAGYVLIIVSRLAAAKASLRVRPYLTSIGLLSLGSVVALSALIPADVVEADLSYTEGREALVALLHPQAGDYVEDVDDYVEDLLDDDTLDPEDRESEIRALNERIRVMEAELALFKATRDQNAAQAAEIEALRKQVEVAMKKAAEAESRPDGRGDIIVTLDGEEVRRVQGFAAAVRPAMPLVRDFAVALASSYPGSYYRNDGDPYGVSTEGMKQIIAIHSYISGEWKYVNDPTSIGADYYSPAHRTIAAGLAGDCDDFSVLVSSAIEAVGGKTRIMGGSCSGGYHAWPEVYIGNRAAFSNAMKVISRAYPGRTIQYMTDSSGGHWLCLDWQLGTYSCGDSPHVMYQRIGGVS
jgi:predicted transglutaminase-like cysteine proteinase